MSDILNRIEAFERAVAGQDREALGNCFAPWAVIRWPNTNEEFDLEDYLTANCDYPGDWLGQVERVEQTERGAVAVARIWAVDESASLRVVSFFRFGTDGRIEELTEYYSDDGPVPQWRRELGLGQPIGKISEESLWN